MSAMVRLVEAVQANDIAAVAAAAYDLAQHGPGCSRPVPISAGDEPGSGGLVPGIDPEVLEAGRRLSERLSDAPVPTQPRRTARRLRAVES